MILFCVASAFTFMLIAAELCYDALLWCSAIMFCYDVLLWCSATSSAKYDALRSIKLGFSLLSHRCDNITLLSSHHNRMQVSTSAECSSQNTTYTKANYHTNQRNILIDWITCIVAQALFQLFQENPPQASYGRYSSVALDNNLTTVEKRRARRNPK